MNKLLLIAPLMLSITSLQSVSSNQFGISDFPGVIQKDSVNQYHKAFCPQLERTCNISFTERSMIIEGFNRIEREQLISFKAKDKVKVDGMWDMKANKSFHIRYLNTYGNQVNAIFVFTDWRATQKFGLALAEWYEIEPITINDSQTPVNNQPRSTRNTR